MTIMKKVVSAITIAAYLVVYLGIDSAGAIQEVQNPSSSIVPKEVLRVNSFILPKNMGTVTDKWTAPGTGQIVIHIQDAHCNYSAQNQIRKLLSYLNATYGVNTLNLEGGAGEYDFSLFTGIRDNTIREKVSDYFVRQGTLSGSESYAINDPSGISVWGVEDTSLYLKNLNVYRESLKDEQKINELFGNMERILNVLKINIFSEDLLEMDLKYSAFKEGNLSFKDYFNFVTDKASEKDVQVEDLRNVCLLAETLEKEGSIDFKQASFERKELVDCLQRVLSQRQLEDLVKKTVDFKDNIIGQDDYYKYLFRNAEDFSISLSRFPELLKYDEYITIYSGVDRVGSVAELAELEDRVRSSLFENNPQKELYLLSKNFILMRNMLDLRLTKNDYKYYIENKEAFDIARYITFIEEQAKIFELEIDLAVGMEDINNYRDDIEWFFRYSYDRDETFLNNIRFGTLEGDSREIAVLVTGGFHSENLGEMFRARNISYISIMPEFSCPKGYESPYFELLAGKTDILKPLLSEVSLLALYSDFSQNASDVYGEDVVKARELWIRLVTALFEGKEYLQVGDRLYSFKELPGSVPVSGVVIDNQQVYAKNSADIDDSISAVKDKDKPKSDAGSWFDNSAWKLLAPFAETALAIGMGQIVMSYMTGPFAGLFLAPAASALIFYFPHVIFNKKVSKSSTVLGLTFATFAAGVLTFGFSMGFMPIALLAGLHLWINIFNVLSANDTWLKFVTFIKYTKRELEVSGIVLSADEIVNHRIPYLQKLKLTQSGRVLLFFILTGFRFLEQVTFADCFSGKESHETLADAMYMGGTDEERAFAVITEREKGIFYPRKVVAMYKGIISKDYIEASFEENLDRQVGSYLGPLFSHHGLTTEDGIQALGEGDDAVLMADVVNHLKAMFGIEELFISCCNPKSGKVGAGIEIPVIQPKGNVSLIQDGSRGVGPKRVSAEKWVKALPAGKEIDIEEYIDALQGETNTGLRPVPREWFLPKKGEEAENIQKEAETSEMDETVITGVAVVPGVIRGYMARYKKNLLPDIGDILILDENTKIEDSRLSDLSRTSGILIVGRNVDLEQAAARYRIPCVAGIEEGTVKKLLERFSPSKEECTLSIDDVQIRLLDVNPSYMANSELRRLLSSMGVEPSSSINFDDHDLKALIDLFSILPGRHTSGLKKMRAWSGVVAGTVQGFVLYFIQRKSIFVSSKAKDKPYIVLHENAHRIVNEMILSKDGRGLLKKYFSINWGRKSKLRTGARLRHLKLALIVLLLLVTYNYKITIIYAINHLLTGSMIGGEEMLSYGPTTDEYFKYLFDNWTEINTFSRPIGEMMDTIGRYFLAAYSMMFMLTSNFLPIRLPHALRSRIITNYGILAGRKDEDIADAYTRYVLQGDAFRRAAEQNEGVNEVYSFLKMNMFESREYTKDEYGNVKLLPAIELSPFGLADGDAIAKLTSGGIVLREDIPMSDELRDWNIRHEEWHKRLNAHTEYDYLKPEAKEVLATIMAFEGIEKVEDEHLRVLLRGFGLDPEKPIDLTNDEFIVGVMHYFADTRIGYKEALFKGENLSEPRIAVLDSIQKGVSQVVFSEVASFDENGLNIKDGVAVSAGVKAWNDKYSYWMNEINTRAARYDLSPEEKEIIAIAIAVEKTAHYDDYDEEGKLALPDIYEALDVNGYTASSTDNPELIESIVRYLANTRENYPDFLSDANFEKKIQTVIGDIFLNKTIELASAEPNTKVREEDINIMVPDKALYDVKATAREYLRSRFEKLLTEGQWVMVNVEGISQNNILGEIIDKDGKLFVRLKSYYGDDWDGKEVELEDVTVNLLHNASPEKRLNAMGEEVYVLYRTISVDAPASASENFLNNGIASAGLRAYDGSNEKLFNRIYEFRSTFKRLGTIIWEIWNSSFGGVIATEEQKNITPFMPFSADPMRVSKFTKFDKNNYVILELEVPVESVLFQEQLGDRGSASSGWQAALDELLHGGKGKALFLQAEDGDECEFTSLKTAINSKYIKRIFTPDTIYGIGSSEGLDLVRANYKELYDSAEKLIPSIVNFISRDAPTYDIAPADFEGQSKVVNMLNRAKRITGKKGHIVHANFYTFGDGENWIDNLKERVDSNIESFYSDILEKPATRMAIRILEGNDKREEIYAFIIEKLSGVIVEATGIAPEKAEREAEKILEKNILIIGENVAEAQQLNNVIDLFADIGMMEVHRYQKGDYSIGAMPDSLKIDLAALLRGSVTNLQDITANNIMEVLDQVFNGDLVLEIRKIDWESIRDWKESNDAILMSL